MTTLPKDLEELVREHTMSCEQIWVDYYGKSIVRLLRTTHKLLQIDYNAMSMNDHQFGLHAEVVGFNGDEIATVEMWCGQGLQETIDIPATATYPLTADELFQQITPCLTRFYRSLMKMRQCSTCYSLTEHHSGLLWRMHKSRLQGPV